MCKCISGYSIQRQRSQVTLKIHFCFHLLIAMGVRPQLHMKAKKLTLIISRDIQEMV